MALFLSQMPEAIAIIQEQHRFTALFKRDVLAAATQNNNDNSTFV